MPLLSLILVTKNTAPFLATAIDQAEACRRDFGAQVVAVDGGSTDGTWEGLVRMQGWTLRRQCREGLAAARNEALEMASGTIIAFLDADDEWAADKTTKQLQALERDPETDVVGALLRKVGPMGDGTIHPAWTPSGCLCRRRAFQRVGPFNERLRFACDHEWFIRARRAGLKMSLIEACLVRKHIHAANLSHRREQYRAELLRVLRSRD
jgi:glycosyltransferase involved in cell wall biosynthesis